MGKRVTDTDCTEALERAAVRYRRVLSDAAEARVDLYELISEASEALSIREIARATSLSPGRIHQIQNGR